MDLLCARFGNLFSCLSQPWLSQANLVDFSQSIDRKGAALDNCWGFIDGTVRPVARPGEHQRVLFNGHKRVHAIKFQSVVAPNGLIVNLFGPVEGRRHDSGMLAMSGLLPMLETHCLTPNWPTSMFVWRPCISVKSPPAGTIQRCCLNSTAATVQFVNE